MKLNNKSYCFQLRLYRNELSVEEVIRSRTEAIFHEKCRDHFSATKLSWKMTSWNKSLEENFIIENMSRSPIKKVVEKEAKILLKCCSAVNSEVRAKKFNLKLKQATNKTNSFSNKSTILRESSTTLWSMSF